MGVLPPQNLRPEVTCRSQIFFVPFLWITIYLRFILSMWCQHLSILLPVDHGSLHVAFRIAGVEREGLASNVALATSLCIEGDYWDLGSCPCLCMCTCCWCWFYSSLLYTPDSLWHLWWWSSQGSPHSWTQPERNLILPTTQGNLKYILYWQVNVSS